MICIEMSIGVCLKSYDMGMPLRLTVKEFGALVRLGDETIRRKIARREIKAQGCPHLISRRELEKFGISMTDAAEYYAVTYPPVVARNTPSRPPASPDHYTSTTGALDSCGTAESRLVPGP
jgi:hypothetical protein